MRKTTGWVLAVGLIAVLFVGWLALGNWVASPATEPELEPEERTLEIPDRDALIVMLTPYVEMAVTGHYGTNNRYAVQVAPYVMEIEQVEQPDRNVDYVYNITVIVEPYANAHITIGEDTLVFEVSTTGISLKEYRHNKDYPLPEYLE